MSIKKSILYKVMGVTGLVGVPVGATLAVVYGSKDSFYEFVQKPAVTFGEKYFDKVIHTEDGVDDSYAMTHILAPNKGHNLLARYVNLSRNYDLKHINNLIAIDKETGNKTKALIYLKIKMEDIHNINQLNREFERINNKLFEEGKKTDDSLGVYAQVDVPTRSIFVVAYKLKPLDDKIGTKVNGISMTKEQLINHFISILPTQDKLIESLRAHNFSFDKEFRQIILSERLINHDYLARLGFFDNDTFNADLKQRIENAKEAFKDKLTLGTYKLNKRIETNKHETNVVLDKDEKTSGDLRDFYRYQSLDDNKLASFPFVIRTNSSEPNWDVQFSGFQEFFEAGIIPTITSIIDWKSNTLTYMFTFYDASDGKSIVVDSSNEDTVRNPAGVSTHRITIPLDFLAPKKGDAFSLDSMQDFVKNETSFSFTGIDSDHEAGHGYMSPETKKNIDDAFNSLKTKADLGRFIIKTFYNLDNNKLDAPFVHYINRDLISDGLKLMGKFLPGLKAPMENFMDLVKKLKDSSSLINPTQSASLSTILNSDEFAEKIVDWLDPTQAQKQGNTVDGESNQFNFNPYAFVYRFMGQFAYEEPRIKTGHEVSSDTNADDQKWLVKSDGSPLNNGDFTWSSISELASLSATIHDGQYNLYDFYTLVSGFSHLSTRIIDYLSNKDKNGVISIQFKSDLNVDTTGTITEVINWAKDNHLIPMNAGINEIIADPFKYLPDLVKRIAKGVPIPKDILEKALPILPIPGLSAADIKVLSEELPSLLSDKEAIVQLFDILRGKNSVDEFIDKLMDKNGLKTDTMISTLITSVLDRKADPNIPGDKDAPFITPSIVARLMNIVNKLSIVPQQLKPLLSAQNIGIVLDLINSGNANDIFKFIMDIYDNGLHTKLSDANIGQFTKDMQHILEEIGENKVYPINKETAKDLSEAIVNILRYGIGSHMNPDTFEKILSSIGSILKIPSEVVDLKPITDFLTIIINGNPDGTGGIAEVIKNPDSFKSLIEIIYTNKFVNGFISKLLPQSLLNQMNLFNTPDAREALFKAIHGLLYGFKTMQTFNQFLQLLNSLKPGILDMNLFAGITLKSLLYDFYNGDTIIFGAGGDISKAAREILTKGILGFKNGSEFKKAIDKVINSKITFVNFQLKPILNKFLPSNIMSLINTIQNNADTIWDSINEVISKPISQITESDIEHLIDTIKIFVPTIALPQDAVQGIMQLKENGLYAENYFGDVNSVEEIIKMIKVFAPDLPISTENILRNIIWGRNNIHKLANDIAQNISSKLEKVFGTKPTIKLIPILQGAGTSNHRNSVIGDFSSLKQYSGLSLDDIISKCSTDGNIDFDKLAQLQSQIDKLIADIRLTNVEQKQLNDKYITLKAMVKDIPNIIKNIEAKLIPLVPGAPDSAKDLQDAYKKAVEDFRSANIQNVEDLRSKFVDAANAYNAIAEREKYLATHRIRVGSIIGNAQFKVLNSDQELAEWMKNHFEGRSLQYLLRGDTSKDRKLTMDEE